MSDSRIINVAGVKVGVTGLDAAIEELAPDYAERDDREVGLKLLERLRECNYIVPHKAEVYAAAFAREFRRALGQPAPEEPPAGLEIRVLGQGCPRCNELEQRVLRVLVDCGLSADFEHVKGLLDISELAGPISPPGLVINGRVVSQGVTPSESEIKQLLMEAGALEGPS